MHPLLKRILWRGIPAAVVLGAFGYLLGAALEIAAATYNAELGGNRSPTRQGALVFGFLGFVSAAGLELLRWRREKPSAQPSKTYTVPPPVPPSSNGL